MPYDKKKHHRRSIRLPGHDYTSPGAYFVTICVQGGECLLGEVVDGEMRLSEFGQVVSHYWNRIPDHVARAKLGEWAEVSSQIILLARGWPRWKGRTWERENALRASTGIYSVLCLWSIVRRRWPTP